MPEAQFVRDWNKTRIELQASTGSGELRQLADGRAGYYEAPASQTITGASSGDFILITTSGVVSLPKASGVLLDGGRAYWDHSANNITYKPTNDRDFYVGTVQGDYASGDTIVQVNLNVQQSNLIDMARDPFDTVFVGTRALGTMDLQRRGGAHKINLSATNEAQKIDMLSQAGFAKGANAIIELIFNVVSDGSGSAVDVSMGAANATHASDAGTITDSLFIHLNANDTNIYAESDDGTTEVAETDTTIDYTEGTPVEVWMDMRNPADVQIYVNSALVLGSTVFNVDASVATWKLLVHVEKSSSTDTYELDINRLCARIMEQ